LPVNFHKRMEQSQQQKNKQRSTRKNKKMGWMFSILAVLSLAMNFTLGPNPLGNAKINDFKVVKDTLIDAKVVQETHYGRYGQVYHPYVLYIKTSSGQTFHLRRPEDQPAQPANYLAVLPIGKEVSIRYFDAPFDGLQILDVRDDNHIYIPFSETMADWNGKRKVIFIFAGIFSLIGIIGFWFGREKQKLHISEHSH